jgi:hypothetical protein
MKRKLFSLAIALFVCALECRAELPRDAKMYIEPFDQFDTYLGAAFSKKHVPVVLVSTADQADLQLSILSDGELITGVRVEGHEKEILWTYLFPKPVRSEMKSAEKCAGQLKHQFPLSPDELARREQHRAAAAAASQASAEPQTICNGNFPIRAGSYLYFPFQIDGPQTVRGSFEVAGGSGNDIQVVVGPRSEVLNWLNGHGGNISYASDKLTSGNLNVALTDPGDYLLAFSNRFSVVSAKSVSANVQLAP